jgi:hypothetical protein
MAVRRAQERLSYETTKDLGAAARRFSTNKSLNGSSAPSDNTGMPAVAILLASLDPESGLN